MAVFEDTIEHLESLSKLRLTSEEREKTKEDIEGILEFLNSLDKYDESAFDFWDKASGNLRDDVVTNETNTNSGTYIVPKTFD